MIKVIQCAGIFAVFCFLLFAARPISPGNHLSSDKLASLDTKNAHQAKRFSIQSKNSKISTPPPNPRSQTQPLSEPVSMLILGTGLIGLSIVGRKIFKD